jgi:hypothetical protein
MKASTQEVKAATGWALKRRYALINFRLVDSGALPRYVLPLSPRFRALEGTLRSTKQ